LEEMTVSVLTTTNWPTYTPPELNIPPLISAHIAWFEDFYFSKFKAGRRLIWQHGLAQCIVKATFPHQRRELAVSFAQAVALLAFNDADTLTCAEAGAVCGLKGSDLKRTMMSLAMPRTPVLKKLTGGKKISGSDKFAFNKAFKSRLFRVKINALQLKETKEEARATTEEVAKDRQYQTDAAIVRIMKTRKRLSHTLLMSELLGQLRFPAEPAMIKKRIESLIDREYLERDEEEETPTYVYLA
jgi:cullin-4